jgi:hypothetical protein
VTVPGAPRWARRCGRSVALPLAACCGLLVVVLVGTGVGGEAAAAAKGSSPTLGTIVIPNLGPGYAVTSQGPLQASQFASDAPDPSAAAGALSTLGKTISTYQRVWQADGGLNQVQNLLVRFPNAVGAQVFLLAAQHSLESGEIVSSDAVSAIPGARRVTYFAATNQDGVGEAVTMRSGVYVDLLSFFSAASGNAQPISPANAEQVALAQYKAMTDAPGGAGSVGGTTAAAGSGATSKKGVTGGTIVLAVAAVAVLSLAVATPLLLRRRRAARDAADDATTMVPSAPSGGDAVHDLREHSS